jgi:hypothetical protein
MATFRACVARHGHGIAQGTLHPGRLRDRRVLEIVAYLQRVAAGDATVVRPVPSRERGGHRISRPLELTSSDPVKRAIAEQRLARQERATKAANMRWKRAHQRSAANARRLALAARRVS